MYAPEESIAGYKRSGHWPDGAAIVMEVHTLKWDDLPAGHVIEEGEPLQWFVMVNDSQGRFPGNPNWGNGWGWAVFSRSDSKKNISTDYKKDCAGCHDVAKGTDWVFVTGYPALR